MDRRQPSGSRFRVVGQLLREPNLRRLGLAYAGYNLAEFASWIVILVFAFEQGGVIESGAAAAAMLIPSALIVPIAATAGDRFPRNRALAAGYASMALSAMACASALWFELPAIWVYAGMLVFCIGVSLSRPLQMGVLVSLTGTTEDLTAANVLNGLIESGGYFAGPLLAALLLPLAGPWAVFAALGVAMTAASGLALRIESNEPSARPIERIERGRIWRDFVETGRKILRETDAAPLIGLLAVHDVLIGALDVLFVAIAFELLGTGDAGAALLNAAFGFGLIGGALLSMSLVGSRRLAIWLTLGGVFAALPLLLLAGVRAEGAALLLIGSAGIGTLLSEVSARTLLQRITPPHRFAQTFGILESTGLLAIALGMVGIAAAVSWLGIGPALVALGLALLMSALALLLPIRRLEALHGPPPERALAALRELAIFQPLGLLGVEQLARAAETVTAEPGEVLIQQGDRDGPFFVLLEGTVEASIDSVPVRTQGPSEYFGEISALRDMPRTATIVATTPIVALAIAPELFLQAVSSHPRSLALARNVARSRRFEAAEAAPKASS